MFGKIINKILNDDSAEMMAIYSIIMVLFVSFMSGIYLSSLIVNGNTLYVNMAEKVLKWLYFLQF